MKLEKLLDPPPVNVIGPLPAAMDVRPETIKLPDCVTAPLPELAVSAPPTLPVPRFKAPVELIVKLPLLTFIWSKPKELTSVITERLGPLAVSRTRPSKLLPTEFSVIASALNVLVPLITKAPDWVIAPLLLAFRLPPTMPAPKLSAPVLTTVSAPTMLRLPSVRSPPLLIVVSFGPVVLRFTVPPKLLETSPKVIMPAEPADRLVLPLTVIAPVCVISPEAETFRVPTVPVPKLNTPALDPIVMLPPAALKVPKLRLAEYPIDKLPPEATDKLPLLVSITPSI